MKVTPQTRERKNDILFNLSRLVGLGDGALIVTSEKLERIIDTSRIEEPWGRGNVVGDVGKLEQRFGLVLIVRLDFSEIGNQVFENLSPS